jgi:hypothetical protein
MGLMIQPFPPVERRHENGFTFVIIYHGASGFRAG